MDTDTSNKKLPMMADVVASFAIAEPPVKKVKSEAVQAAWQRLLRHSAVDGQPPSSLNSTQQTLCKPQKFIESANKSTLKKNFRLLGFAVNAMRQNAKFETMPIDCWCAKGLVAACFITLVPAYSNLPPMKRTSAKIVRGLVMHAHFVKAMALMSKMSFHVRLQSVVSSFTRLAWKWRTSPSN